jgi:Tfp pilus assembly protein PilF
MKRRLLTAAAMILLFARLADAQSAAKQAPTSDAQPLAVLLEQGIYQEETAGNFDAAAKTYRQIADQAAVSRALVAQALSRLVALQVKQKQLDDARQTIERLKTEYPEQKDTITKAVALLPNENRGARGRNDHDAGPSEQKERVPNAEEKAKAAELAKRGWQSYRDGQLRAATDLFRTATALDPTSADAWTGLGWAMMNSNQLTGQNEFARALQLDPKNAMALNGMGWAISHMGDVEDQRRNTNYWRLAVEADPTATSPMRGLAKNAYQNADFDEAIKWYEKWLALDPNNADASASLAQAKQRKAAVNSAMSVATDFFKLLDERQFSDTQSLTAKRTIAVFNSGEIRGNTEFSRNSRFPQRTIGENRQDWFDFLAKYRAPLGKTILRSLESVKYTQDRVSVGTAGDRARFDTGFNPFRGVQRAEPNIVLQFTSKYENKRNVVELLSLEQTAEGDWRINTYGIEETETPRDPLRD